MATNSFGNIFKITTWGESHGKAIGVVIDGCPAGLTLSTSDIQAELMLRRPGNSPYTSPRKEEDLCEILSGVFEGQTTGAPISIIIPNKDADCTKYEALKDVLRPGHANFTYLEKYGIFDHRGGGRSSARETACRVAAGAVALKLLQAYSIEVTAYLYQVGTISCQTLDQSPATSPIFCPDSKAQKEMIALLDAAIQEGDSLGGIIAFSTSPLPVGLGDPVYEKLEANLAKAMLSIPASKAFEIGEGIGASTMKGSEHNDTFTLKAGRTSCATNHAGGILGGISTGMPLFGKVAFKPTSSIKKEQDTLTTSAEKTTIVLPEGSRHDPCLSIRAVPVVKAMAALVLADALLMNRCCRI